MTCSSVGQLTSEVANQSDGPSAGWKVPTRPRVGLLSEETSVWSAEPVASLPSGAKLALSHMCQDGGVSCEGPGDCLTNECYDRPRPL